MIFLLIDLLPGFYSRATWEAPRGCTGCVREVGERLSVWFKGGGGAHLSRVRAKASGCEETKEKFLSVLSWFRTQLASLEQHGKWHNHMLNPACFVCSSDHEMNHPQRCIQNDTRYGPRARSQRGPVSPGATRSCHKSSGRLSPTKPLHTEIPFDISPLWENATVQVL